MNSDYTSLQSQKIAIYSEEMESFRIHTVSNGYDPGKPTLLLQHGYLGSVRDYYPFFSRFSDKFNILSFDLRGHGKSDSPSGDWTIDSLVSDTYQVVRQMIPEGQKLIVVGNSLSTAITLSFASKYPELIQKIFLISPTSKFSISLMRRFVIKWMAITPDKLISSSLKLVDLSINNILGDKSGAKAKDAIEKIRHISVPVHKKILQATLPSYDQSVAEIQIPMMIVAGEKDNIVPFMDSLVVNANAPQSSILVLKNTKHLILVTRTNLILDIFEQWINTQSELLTDVEHYHEDDLVRTGGHVLLPEEWESTQCDTTHLDPEKSEEFLLQPVNVFSRMM